MLDSKLDQLIRSAREDRFNAYRYLVLGAGFEDEGKVRCGRGQHEFTNDFCCAEWAYMRAWVLWPRLVEKDEALAQASPADSEGIRFAEPEENAEDEGDDESTRNLPPAQELARIRGWESRARLAAARLREIDSPESRPFVELIAELASLGHPDAVGPLLAVFGNPASPINVCAEASRALAAIGDPVAIPSLIRYLATSGTTRTTTDILFKTSLSDLLSGAREEKEAFLLAKVIEALGAFGDPKAVRPIQNAMQSPYTAVREASAVALGRIGGEEATQTLAKRIGDRKTRVVRAAQVALSRLEDPEVRASMILAEFLKDPSRNLDKTAKALLECGSHAVTMLLEVLPGAEGGLRELGMRVLSNIGDDEALEEMLASLEDPDPSLRVLVAETIANNPHRPGRAVAALKKLRDSDPEESVRKAADAAIEKIMNKMF